MAQSKLEQVAIQQRASLEAMNAYNDDAPANTYTASHSRALSDTITPEAGRGTGNFLDTTNYNAGTQTDIAGDPTQGGTGRLAAFANNGSTWGYTPDAYYQAPDTSLNTGQVIID